MKLHLCGFSYSGYFHSMLHLIKCCILCLQGTSAGPKSSRLLTHPPEPPHPTATGKPRSIARFWNLAQLLLCGKPRFLQGRLPGISKSPQINGKSLILAEIGKAVSHCSSLFCQHCLEGKPCNAGQNMRAGHFDVGPSEPSVSQVRSSGNGQAVAPHFDLFFLSPACKNGYLSSRNYNHIQDQVTTECSSQYSYFWLTETAKTPLFSMALHHLSRSQKSRELPGNEGLRTWVLVGIQG